MPFSNSIRLHSADRETVGLQEALNLFPSHASVPKANILLVDDDPANLLTLRAMLNDLDQNLVEVKSGEDAIRRVKEVDFAVVLMDVQMLGVDGFEAAKQIRNQNPNHTPIIFLTDYDSEQFPVDQAYLLGAVDYLVRPLSSIIVRAKVTAFVELQTKSLLLLRQAEQIRVVQQQIAQDQIQSREQELSDFFENATIGLHLVGPDGIILRANRAELELLGYTWEEYVGQSITKFHDDKDAICDILENLRGGHDIHEYPSRLLCKDGSIKEVLIVSSVLFKDGQFIHTRCFTMDVTERNRVEASIRKQEQLTRTILESITDAFCSFDREWRFVYANKQAEALLDRNRSDLLAKNLWTEYPRLIGTEIELKCRRAVTDQVAAEFEFYSARNDRWFELHAYPSAEGLSIYFRDSTDRRRNQDRISSELSAMTSLHELVDRLLAQTDLNGALQEVLDSAIAMLHADMGNIQRFDQIQGGLTIVAQNGFKQDFLDFFRLVKSDDSSACARTMNRGERVVIEDVEVDPLYEPLRSIAASAGYRGVQSTPLVGRTGQVLGMLSTHFREPHSPSELELRTLDLYARQAADFIERLRTESELRKLAADLSETDRRKSEFLATLAHELRNPLAPIRNALQIIQVAPSDDQAVDLARQIMERQLQQMVRLIDDLLEISRIDQGKIVLRREWTTLALAVGNAVEASRPVIDESGHQLTVTSNLEPIYLHADSTRLTQIFLNLLNNAAKYTEPGGRITVAIGLANDQAVISIKDNGIGISKEMLPKVFDLFTQVDRSLEKSQGGLGIGLSLVKRLVELHGGSVEAHSAGIAGQGSEFVVKLPATHDRPPGESPVDNSDGLSKQKSRHRILIADDNKDSADTLSMLLRLHGNETAISYDGQAAVELAGDFAPGVVLLDIGMPRLNGYEVAKQLRTQPGGNKLILIALTGWGQDDDIYDLTKPASTTIWLSQSTRNH